MTLGPRYETMFTTGGSVWNVAGDVRHGEMHFGRDQVNGGTVNYYARAEGTNISSKLRGSS